MKDAGFRPLGEFSLQGGMYGNKRVTGDFGRPLNEKVAFRVNGMFEDSASFRNEVTLNRKGITPTVTFEPSRSTTISARYEYLDDTRVADRGITSYQGRPANVPDDTFYGDPEQSHVQATVNLASGLIEHRRGAMTVRNHTLVGGYDRFYQNFVPGAVTPNMSQVALTTYNNATQRNNFFNQTDVTYIATTGSVRHTFLAGTEFGLQGTDNFRNTGYFNNTTTSLLVPFSAPTISTPVTFRQSATDANNHLDTTVAAAYAQDQRNCPPTCRSSAGCASIVSTSRTTTTATATSCSAWTTWSRRVSVSWSSRSIPCRSTRATACRISRAQAISSRR